MENGPERRTIDVVFTLLGTLAVVGLLIGGTLALVASNFAKTQVQSELQAQKIFFPPKGSPALDPKEFPGLQQYAGQQVDTGPEAKAYADEFIAVHLEGIGGGKTYSEVSAEALQNPDDEQLQAQADALFKGETLRGLLLLGGYVPWVEAQIAFWAGVGMYVFAIVMLVLVILGFRHIRKSRPARAELPTEPATVKAAD